MFTCVGHASRLRVSGTPILGWEKCPTYNRRIYYKCIYAYKHVRAHRETKKLLRGKHSRICDILYVEEVSTSTIDNISKTTISNPNDYQLLDNSIQTYIKYSRSILECIVVIVNSYSKQCSLWCLSKRIPLGDGTLGVFTHCTKFS